MMASPVELYDVLRRSMDEEVAKVLAESISHGGNVATKEDIALLSTELSGMEARLTRWMLGFFAPLWIATYGTLAAVIFLVIRT